jgi:hypothetical protein
MQREEERKKKRAAAKAKPKAAGQKRAAPAKKTKAKKATQQGRRQRPAAESDGDAELGSDGGSDVEEDELDTQAYQQQPAPLGDITNRGRQRRVPVKLLQG